MNRKKFIKNGLLGMVGMGTMHNSIKAMKVKPHKSTFDEMMHQVGFNHLPNKEIKTMKSVLHRANTRGHANHGWLDTNHSFSFASYYNPERMNFGVLRVLNDDRVAPGRGFPTHPHDNMEIISIPLEGALEHKDSMGNIAVIKEGDLQVMSAGTGIQHSEYNKNSDAEVKFLQIWLFPNKKNVKPRYDQIKIDKAGLKNNLVQLLSPSPDDEGVWIHQDAWFHMGVLEPGTKLDYTIKRKDNGIYTFVLNGMLDVNGQDLNPRDGYGVWDTEGISLTARSASRVLLMEVPMSM